MITQRLHFKLQNQRRENLFYAHTARWEVYAREIDAIVSGVDMQVALGPQRFTLQLVVLVSKDIGSSFVRIRRS